MAWYFADEKNPYADRVARQLLHGAALVPLHWPLEMANTLCVGERRKRSTQAQAAKLLHSLAVLPITIDDDTNLHAWTGILSLAREQNVSVYDAAYLELALRRDRPLATLDDALNAAAHRVGVPIY
jgi:predicted nucleic acid-binding protein